MKWWNKKEETRSGDHHRGKAPKIPKKMVRGDARIMDVHRHPL